MYAHLSAAWPLEFLERPRTRAATDVRPAVRAPARALPHLAPQRPRTAMPFHRLQRNARGDGLRRADLGNFELVQLPFPARLSAGAGAPPRGMTRDSSFFQESRNPAELAALSGIPAFICPHRPAP